MIKFKKGDILISNGKCEVRKGTTWIVSSIKETGWNPENISVRAYNLRTKKYTVFSYIFNQHAFCLYYKDEPVYQFLLRK